MRTAVIAWMLALTSLVSGVAVFWPAERARAPRADAVVRIGAHSGGVAFGGSSARLAAADATTAPYELVLKKNYDAPPQWTMVTPETTAEGYPLYYASEIADFNGDGRKDMLAIVVSMPPPYPIRAHIFLQQTDGTLAPPVEVPFPGNFDSHGGLVGTDAADVNGDGVVDLVLTRSSSITAMLSNGRGGWDTSSVTWPNEFEAEVPAVAIDLDDDGRSDVVTHVGRGYSRKPADPRSHFLVYYGDGGGGFPTVRKIVSGEVLPEDKWTVRSLVDGDFNRDGRRDIAARFEEGDYAAQIQRHAVKVYANDGAGGFAAPYTVTTDFTRERLVAGDFNGDGATDLAAAHNSTMFQYKTINVYLQRNGRLLESPQIVSTGSSPGALDAADLDGDGKDDLAVVFDAQLSMAYYLQRDGMLRPGGSLGVGTHFSARAGASAQGIGDLNGDRCADVAIAQGYGSLNLLEGRNCSVRVARKSSPTPAEIGAK